MRRAAAVILMGAVLAPVGASAQDGAVYFDCGTKPGYLSRMTVIQPPGNRHISGKLKAVHLDRIAKWRPTAQVMLTDGNAGAGIRVACRRPKCDIGGEGVPLDLLVTRKEVDKLPQEERITAIPLGQEVSFDISTEGDTFSIRVGDLGRTLILLLGSPRKLELGCSTGDFEFIDVVAE